MMYGSGMGGDNPAVRVVQFARRGDVDGMMQSIQSFIAGMGGGFGPPHLDNKIYYCDVISTVFMMCSSGEVNYDVHGPHGFIDMLLEQKPYYYGFKFKRTGSGGVKAAEAQIKAQDYLYRYASEGNHVYGVAVEIPDRGFEIIRWKEVPVKNAH